MTINLLDKVGGVLHTFQCAFLGKTEQTGIKMSYATNENTVSKFQQDIVEQCFPQEDAGTLEELMADVEADDCAVIVAKENNEILGGVVVSHYWSTGKKVMLISWLAVHENHRGRNVGTLLIEEAMSYARKNGALILLGQVENPDIFKESRSAYGNPTKRVKFYSRFDCQRLEVPCYIPAFYDHQEPVVGIMLTLFPLSEEQKMATELYLPELSVFVEELVGYDTGQESLDFVAACKESVSLSSFRDLYCSDKFRTADK